MRQGSNTITRASTESTLTIPFDRTFRDLDTNRPEGGDALAQFNFCGCGWPQHMLVPMGNAEGMQCELFVMISNIEDDRVRNIFIDQKNCISTPILNIIAYFCTSRSSKMSQESATTPTSFVVSRTSFTQIVVLWVIHSTDKLEKALTLWNSS